MIVSVAGRFLAMHISILPIKDPLNLNGWGGVAIDCCCTAWWKAMPASEKAREKETETEGKEERGMIKERAGVGGEEKKGTAGLRLNIVNLKDGGKEIYTRHSHGHSHVCTHKHKCSKVCSFLTKPLSQSRHCHMLQKLRIDYEFFSLLPILSLACSLSLYTHLLSLPQLNFHSLPASFSPLLHSSPTSHHHISYQGSLLIFNQTHTSLISLNTRQTVI